jgi:hypothetical protein
MGFAASIFNNNPGMKKADVPEEPVLEVMSV